MFNVLFLCTGNSCRSILAEAYLNHIGNNKFRAYSAGSHPTGEVNPHSLETLVDQGIATDGLHSKSTTDLKDTRFDLVVTVCDNAAGESCPIFPGGPVKVHWGVPDPAHFVGNADQTKAEFERVFAMLRQPIDSLARLDVTPPIYATIQQIKSIEISAHDSTFSPRHI